MIRRVNIAIYESLVLLNLLTMHKRKFKLMVMMSQVGEARRAKIHVKLKGLALQHIDIASVECARYRSEK